MADPHVGGVANGFADPGAFMGSNLPWRAGRVRGAGYAGSLPQTSRYAPARRAWKSPSVSFAGCGLMTCVAERCTLKGDAGCDRRAIRPALNLPFAFAWERLPHGPFRWKSLQNNNACLCFNSSCILPPASLYACGSTCVTVWSGERLGV